jgi:hypothetical protein
MDFFETARPPQGDRSISLRCGELEISITGMGGSLAGSCLERYGPFAEEPGGEKPSLALSLHVAKEDHFIRPPERPQRNPILLACDGSRIRYLGYRVAGWFDLQQREGALVLSRGDYERDELALENFLLAAVAWVAVEDGGALVHASGVVYRERGFLFYGPSGAGKSTAAGNAGGGTVIGDDVSLVLPGPGGGLHLVGNPFRGGFRSAAPVVGSFPLAAGFRLVKAERIEVVDIPRARAFGELVGNLPYVADSFGVRPDLMERIELAFREVPLNHLHFLKEGSCWGAIGAAGLIPGEGKA